MFRLTPFDAAEPLSDPTHLLGEPTSGGDARGPVESEVGASLDGNETEPVNLEEALADARAGATAASRNEPEDWPYPGNDSAHARESRDAIDGLFRDVARVLGFAAGCARPTCRRANACVAERPACILGDSEIRRAVMDAMLPMMRARLAEWERARGGEERAEE